MKIYEDQALGKLDAERYTTLYNRYQEEQNGLKQWVRNLRVTIADEKKEVRSASKFIKLVDRYADFTVLTPVMLNEFVDKVVVHERERKNSIQTTQKAEIYFNFIGEYSPSTIREPEPTEEEKAEMARIEALKDKRHAQYMARRADGRDANYNKQVARRRAQQREDRRKTRHWEDIQAWIYHYLGTTTITAKEETEDAEPILVAADIPRA